MSNEQNSDRPSTEPTEPTESPETAADTPAETVTEPTSRPPRRSAFPVVLGGLALVIALLAVAFAWISRDQVTRMQAEFDSAMTDTRAQLADRTAALPETVDAVGALRSRVDRLAADLDDVVPQLESGIESRFDGLDQRITALHDALEKAMAPTHEPADVEHLLLIANDSLILLYDIPTAIAALETADRRLSAIADPAFSETRRVLAREINALKATPRPDIAGLAFTISGLQEDVEALTLESLRAPGGERSAPSMTPMAGDPDEAGWRAMLQDVWESLSSLVVIRRSDELEGPLLGPEQRVFLNQNLRQRLESARLALLTRDTASFHHHLDTTREWLGNYYDSGDAKVAALLERLEELGDREIRPELPDISGSLKALREALAQRRSPILEEPDA